MIYPILHFFSSVTLVSILMISAPQALHSMNIETSDNYTIAKDKPTAIVLAFLSAMEKMDFDEALKHVTDSCEYTNGAAGTKFGPEGVREFLEPFFSQISKNEIVILRNSSTGPIVFVERLDKHLLKSGKWIELPVSAVFEVHDGKITLWHEYFDLATIRNQMAN